MKIGYFGFNIGRIGTPDAMARVVRTADDAGFESLWTGEHVVLVDPQEPPSPVPPETPFLDTIAALAFAAAHSDRLKLGSGIILLAQRNPVVLAKELAGVDVLSKGRLLVGVGVGYVPREFEAIGVPFEERGARTSEHIEVLRALWTQDRPTFAGRFTQFSGIQSHPHPVQRPHPPVHVGGMSAAAHRRAVVHGNGWYGYLLDLDATRAALDGLAAAAKRVERPEGLGELEISITPPPGVTADTVKRYADLGVERLVLLPDRRAAVRESGRPEDATVAFLEETARELDLG